MSENWKPGDVAMRVSRVSPDETAVATRVAGCTATEGLLADEPHWHFVSRHTPTPQCGADGAADYHRLAVIDAEDREQVERLLRAWYECDYSSQALLDKIPRMQAALREFANPTPRIEEPTEFAAIAVDADGEVWHRVRDGEGDGYPWATKDSKAKWQNLKIVRTLPAPEVTP